MADFDLIQTDAQAQSILNDGQNMQGAGAQTTLTTESVLLKDVNGNYHKILKSSFTEAIRDTLAGLLVNNDKGTTINQIAAIASGDFGSITPANLASVLGVNAILWEENFGTGLASAVLTKRGLRQAILIVTQNGPNRAPSIYVLKRGSIYHTICEGETKAADISIDSTTGDITISKQSGLTMYTRTILLEA